MGKGFISPLILIVLIGATIGGLVYFRPQTTEIISNQQQATPDPFPNWKTYKNSSQGFTIRYPQELFVKEHITDAADFLAEPNLEEASPGAIKIRYSSSQDNADLKSFEKIYKTDEGAEIREHLDVKSIITKIKNLEVEGYRSIDYVIDRTFSALEGPKTEFTHVYEVDKNGVILKFSSSAETKESRERLNAVFEKMISSIKF